MLSTLEDKLASASKSVSKKEKPTVIRRLKAVIGTIATGKGPSVKPLKHEGKFFMMDDWTSYLRMRLLRIILGSGLYHHLKIHYIFEEMFTVAEDIKLDRLAIQHLKLQQKEKDTQQRVRRLHKQFTE